MKIVFFGTSNVALPVLERLNRKHEILAVVTQPDAKVGRKQEFTESPVSILAKEMNLKVLKPQKVKDNNLLRLELQALGAELFVVVAFGQILPLEIINLPKWKTLNVHFSLLPKYRGPSPIQTALLNGEKETGVSIFLLDEQIDHGPLLAQEKMAVDDDDNFLTLSERLAQKSAGLVSAVVDNYVQGLIKPIFQDHAKASLTKIITKADGRVNWQNSAWQIYNQFRAFYPWPGIWTKWQNKTLKILDCLPVVYQEEPQVPGVVLAGGAVVCEDHSALEIRSLQLEGKNPIRILDFLNGYRNFPNSRLSV